MDGIREQNLAENSNPNNDFKVRALDDQGKSCIIPFSSFYQGSPQENEIRDFLEGSTIKKKRYTQGQWVETGIEYEI